MGRVRAVMVAEVSGAEGWWMSHPAYQDIKSALDGHVVPSSASHLAFLMLVGLHERGWAVAREEKMLDN